TRVDLGGRDLTEYLRRLLRQRGYTLTSSAEREIVRDIKEKLCYVALDPEKELKLAEKVSEMEKTYMLPDGSPLTIGAERFLAPEVFFIPGVIGLEAQPLDEVIVETIEKCDVDLRRDLYSNIVLSGGSTMFPGLKERLTKEIKEMIPETVDVKIIAPPERMYRRCEQAVTSVKCLDRRVNSVKFEDISKIMGYPKRVQRRWCWRYSYGFNN
ncbi:MAG: hypothetical protein ACTSQY_11005, partial [Candidatus Odinarchaeia archaeon]